MAKAKKRYVCQKCGYVSVRSLGRCPNCQAWNSLVEEVIAPETSAQQSGRSETMPLKVVVRAAAMDAPGEWRVSASFACCTTSDRGVCVPVELRWSVPLKVGGDATSFPVTAEPRVATRPGG